MKVFFLIVHYFSNSLHLYSNAFIKCGIKNCKLFALARLKNFNIVNELKFRHLNIREVYKNQINTCKVGYPFSSDTHIPSNILITFLSIDDDTEDFINAHISVFIHI